MAAKLDFTKPYGTMHGTLDNRRYEQNGKIFDGDGNEIVPLDLSPLTSGPRPRTRAEEAQYQKDVVEAAKLLAAGKS